MTPKQEAALRLALEAFIKRGFWPNEVMWECWKDAWIQGAAAEREGCAKVCDYIHELEVLANPAEKCAAAIRARGQA